MKNVRLCCINKTRMLDNQTITQGYLHIFSSIWVMLFNTILRIVSNRSIDILLRNFNFVTDFISWYQAESHSFVYLYGTMFYFLCFIFSAFSLCSSSYCSLSATNIFSFEFFVLPNFMDMISQLYTFMFQFVFFNCYFVSRIILWHITSLLFMLCVA